MPIQNSRQAKALSKVGSAKGGRARATVLTAEERSEIGRKAVMARWAKAGKLKSPPSEAKTVALEIVEDPAKTLALDLPFSMFRGTLDFGPFKMECHVLSDMRRVFTQREIVRVLSGRESGGLADYIKAIPLEHNTLLSVKTIDFRVAGTGAVAIGREATFLIELCSAYMDAEPRLKGNQKRFAEIARVIIRACAKVGVIALVDEATGFEKVRAARSLQMKLQAFIAEDLQEWAKRFPDEFWFELARLEGIHYSPRNRPLRWGKYIMAFVYDAIDKDVGKALRAKNPNPHYGKNHHQWLKEFGKEKLIGQIQSVITIMKLCENMDEFRTKFDRVFRKTPLQYSFDDINWGIPATVAV